MKYLVYILYSYKLNRYYIGTTDDIDVRLKQHNSMEYSDSFTTKGIPWERFLMIEDLTSKQAYAIEKHIKQMKSTKYYHNLAKYPELILKLKLKFEGS